MRGAGRSPRSTASASAAGSAWSATADIVVASDDAYFGVPEVKQGALGAATHLARLVPQHLMRTLYFTARTDQGRRARPARLGPRGGAARRAGRRRAAGRRRHRRQGHPGDPGRQGGAQRDRPGRRQQELPVRAGLHLRAQPDGRQRRAARRRSRARTRPSGRRTSDQGTPRQADEHRRGRRRARGRHDHRHRRLGSAAQADGAGPRDPALRPQGPHARSAGAAPTSACSVRAGKVQASWSTRSSPSTPCRWSRNFQRARQAGHHPRGRRARRGDVPDRAARRGPAAAVPADARRARLRRAGQQPADQDRHQPVRRRRRSWSRCPRSSSTSPWCT